MRFMIDKHQPGSTYQEAGVSQPHRIIKLTGEDGCSAEVRVTADWSRIEDLHALVLGAIQQMMSDEP